MVPEVKNYVSSVAISLLLLKTFEETDKAVSKISFYKFQSLPMFDIFCIISRHFAFRSEAREDPFTDYYIWKDANSSNPGGVPNNW